MTSERRKIVVQTYIGPEAVTGPNVTLQTSAGHLLVVREDQPERIIWQFEPGTWHSVETTEDEAGS